jgi:hypothetical protein
MSRRVLVVVALLGLLATGCQVKIAAQVDVGRDGRGRVSAGLGMDADALAEVGDPATALRVDDLRRAGWEVEGPRKEGDGLTWVRVSKPFADSDQAMAAMAELSGPGGPFKDFRLVRTKSLLRSKTTFTGVVDLAGGLAGLSDPDLTGQLGDVDLGLDVEGLKRRFGDDLAKTVQVQVSAGLPGTKIKTNAPARDGGRAVWAPELGQTVQMEASSEALKVDPRLVVAAGGAIGLVIVAGALASRRRKRRRRR